MDHKRLQDHLAIRRSDTGELVALMWHGPGLVLFQAADQVPTAELLQREDWLPIELADHLQRIGVTHVNLQDEFARPEPQQTTADKPRKATKRKATPKTSAAPGP